METCITPELLWRYSRRNPRYLSASRRKRPLAKLRDGLSDFWSFAVSIGFPEFATDYLIAAFFFVLGLFL